MQNVVYLDESIEEVTEVYPIRVPSLPNRNSMPATSGALPSEASLDTSLQINRNISVHPVPPSKLHSGREIQWIPSKLVPRKNINLLILNPYSHFPGIYQMLHFLLLKLYPITFKKREDQILEEKKRDGYFSPEFNGHACESQTGEFNYLGIPSHSSAFSESPFIGKEKLGKLAGQVEFNYNGTIPTKENSDGDLSKVKPVAEEENDQVLVTDLL
ncbi:hypothetical protein REPUB_Repub01dG0124200 [Reevesia pubescens]